MNVALLENDPNREDGFALLKVDLTTRESIAKKPLLNPDTQEYDISIKEVRSGEYLQKGVNANFWRSKESFFKVAKESLTPDELILSIPPSITEKLVDNLFYFSVKDDKVSFPELMVQAENIKRSFKPIYKDAPVIDWDRVPQNTADSDVKMVSVPRPTTTTPPPQEEDLKSNTKIDALSQSNTQKHLEKEELVEEVKPKEKEEITQKPKEEIKQEPKYLTILELEAQILKESKLNSAKEPEHDAKEFKEADETREVIEEKVKIFSEHLQETKEEQSLEREPKTEFSPKYQDDYDKYTKETIKDGSEHHKTLTNLVPKKIHDTSSDKSDDESYKPFRKNFKYLWLLLIIPLAWLLLAYLLNFFPFASDMSETIVETEPTPEVVSPPLQVAEVKDPLYFTEGCWETGSGLMGGTNGPELSVDYTYCFTSPNEALVTISELDTNGHLLDICRTTASFQLIGNKLTLNEDPGGPICQNFPDVSYYSSSLSCDITQYGLSNCEISSVGLPDKIIAIFKKSS
jgi:hypothetical protein